MSSTEKIIGELEASMVGLRKARGHVDKAVHHCDEVATRMFGAGFAGVGQGVVQVRDLLGKIQARIGGIAGELRQAAAPVREIDRQMSPEQVSGKLVAGNERSAAARTNTAGTAEDCVQAAHLTQAVLQGGQPGPLLSMIEAARTSLFEVIGRIDSARQRTDEAINEAGQAGQATAGN